MTSKVLLLGATGETGGDILNGLKEDGSFEITCLVQPSSASKPAVQFLKDSGLNVVIGDLTGSVDDLAKVLTGHDIVISAISAPEQLAQLTLVDAAAKAGVKRFVPCGFTTIAPRGGVMILRDHKEEVHDRIFYHHLPYTIIDVGFWHQISFPPLPSGRLDSLLMFNQPLMYAGGDAPSLLTDKRDIGRFVARIIKDDRTLNKRIVTYSEELSQKQIWDIMEQKSGEKMETVHVTAEQLYEQEKAGKEALASHPGDFMKAAMMYLAQYSISKYVRRDNTVENAKYLGYLDARELYPDFKPISFAEYIDEALAGKGYRPYTSFTPPST